MCEAEVIAAINAMQFDIVETIAVAGWRIFLALLAIASMVMISD